MAVAIAIGGALDMNDLSEHGMESYGGFQFFSNV